MIYLSHSAIDEVKRLQSKYQKSDMALRLGVQSSGCSGMSYQMEFEQELQPNDQIYEFGGMRVAVDSQSLSYIDGLTLDYTEDLMGGGFRFHNPNAIKTCGCGSSFAMSEQPPL
jgi:iron-sulfur cluster assembly protein